MIPTLDFRVEGGYCCIYRNQTNRNEKTMTLNTVIGLRGKFDFDDVVNYANRLIEAENPRCSDGPSEYHDGLWTYSNNPGQGYSAWLFAHRSLEGVGETKGVWTRNIYDDDYDKVIGQEDYDVNIRLEFDTVYGYNDPRFGGCTELHAYIILSLNEYVKKRGGSLIWQDEYNGNINEGSDGMEKFLGRGDEAMEWFSSIKDVVLKRAI